MSALLRMAKALILLANASQGAAGRLAAPWLALAIRVWIAQAFLASQIADVMLGRRLDAPLTASWWFSLAHQVAGSPLGVAIQVLCPVLVLLGLLTRPAAVAMLLQLLLVAPVSMQSERAVLAVALLGWLAVAGPGALSLDRLLGPGVATSPVPGLAAIGAFYRGLSRLGVPLTLLGLRAWLAAGLLVAASWLPRAAMASMLAEPGRITLAAMLAFGLLTRPTALLLAVLVPVSALMGVGDERLHWLLVLAVLAVHGGGPFAVDRLLGDLIGATAGPAGGPHVVIVGGGFGGVAAARGLRDAACRVTLIDRANHHLFQPLLYQVATAGLSPADIATPIRAMFRDQANLRTLLGEVTGVDTAGRAVLLGAARITYDTLILATGARHAYLGHDEWAPFAPGLKSVEDATDIRRRLLIAFEAAEAATDPAERGAWLTFVVVGGGPTGVELAGAIAELARTGLAGEFRSIDPASARVVLVQSGPRVLPSFPEDLSAAAERGLLALGVEVRLDRRVTAVRTDAVVIGEDELPTRTVLWAAGVMASPAARWLGVEGDRSGRVPVGPELTVAGLPEVFVIGDTAASRAWHGEFAPGLAPAAKQAGTYVAKMIRARLSGRLAGRGPAPFRYRHFGSLATIGRQSAVAEFGRVHVRGALAWWLWGAAHIAFLAGGRNRVTVVIEWLWAYLTLRHGTRLITGR